MSTTVTLLMVFAAVFGAAMFGMILQQILPDHHFSSETKDTVKATMGFVATMAALILGLLVASAKDSYDKQASGVTEMAAKVLYLDRLLADFGPETQDVRARYRRIVERVAKRIWPANSGGDVELDPTAVHSEDLLGDIESLEAKTPLQSAVKTQAASVCLDLGELRWLEYEQASGSASKPLVYILVFWTAVLFASFGMFAPRNGTVVTALALAALSVTGAIFLLIELRSPFTGVLQIPQTPFVIALEHLGR